MTIEGPLSFPGWTSRSRSAPQDTASPVVDGDATTRVASIAAGRAEFETAVRPALPKLYRFCLGLAGRSDQADDLLQNTLIKAYLNASSYEGRSELIVWLCGIAWHEHLEVRRTETRRKGLFEQFVGACTAALGFGPERGEQMNPETMVAEGQTHSHLLTCLQTLPEDFRAVVVLCDLEELGYERAAEILNIPKGTVKSRHARGRARLREAYEKRVLAAPATSTQSIHEEASK